MCKCKTFLKTTKFKEMSGYVNLWMHESDFHYIVFVLRNFEHKTKKRINLTISDYIPDFHISPDESDIECIYLPGHPKNSSNKTINLSTSTVKLD